MIEKILQQLPYSEGSTRRRFVTGLIFFAVLSVNYWSYLPYGDSAVKVSSLEDLIGIEPKDLLTSPQTLFVATIILFVIGSIADAIIAVYIVGGASTTIALFRRPLALATEWHPFFRLVCWASILLLSFFTLPLAILICTITNSLGYKKSARIGLMGNESLLSEEGKSFYEGRLSATTQDGLDQLYGDHSAGAWQRIIDFVPERHRPWVGRLNNRNRDVASYVTSAMIAVFFSFSVIPLNWVAWLTTYCIIFFLSYLFLGCAVIVQRSTVSVLELAADTQEEMNVS